MNKILRLALLGTLVTFYTHPLHTHAYAPQAEDLEVKGKVRFRSFDQKRVAVIDEWHSFSLIIHGCTWSARLELHPDNSYDYHEVAFDGSTVYAYSPMLAAINRLRDEDRGAGPNEAAANVVRSPVPRLPSVHALSPVWIAFASRCYFADRTDNAELPIVFSRNGETSDLAASVKCPFHIEWLAQQNTFPESITFFSKSVFNPQSPTLETNTVYSVQQSKILGSMMVPVTATLQSFVKFPDEPYRQLVEYNLIAESVSTNNVPPIKMPVLSLVTAVGDFRFARDANGAMMTYVRRGSFPTDDQVRRHPDYEGEVKSQRLASQAVAESKAILAKRDISRRFPLWLMVSGSLSLVTLLVIVKLRSGITNKRTKARALVH